MFRNVPKNHLPVIVDAARRNAAVGENDTGIPERETWQHAFVVPLLADIKDVIEAASPINLKKNFSSADVPHKVEVVILTVGTIKRIGHPV